MAANDPLNYIATSEPGSASVFNRVVKAILVQSGLAELGAFPGFVNYPVLATETGVTKPWFNYGNVKRFGAVGNGVTDDTTAIRNAITSAQASADNAGAPLYYGAVVYFPQGTFYITDTLTINDYRIQLVGEGKYATTLLFNPASAKACVKFLSAQSSTILGQCAVRGMSFYGQGSQQKIGIDATDVSEMLIQDVLFVGNSWKGNSGSTSTPSIGIRLAGREYIVLDRVGVYADRPLEMVVNPNLAQNCDFVTIRDSYFHPEVDTEDCISIPTPGTLTNLCLDNVSMHGGRHGLYWNNDVAAYSVTVNLSNIRREQTAVASRATGYTLNIIGGGCKHFTATNIQSDSQAQGFKIICDPTSSDMTLVNLRHEGSTGEAFNILASNAVLIGCHAGAGSTINLNAMEERLAINVAGNLSLPIPRFAIFGSASETYKHLRTQTLALAAGLVTYGAADSAGAGFRTMRVPN